MATPRGGDERARAVIRAPNHLGELVLALPALEAASRRWPGRPVVQVVEELVPVLDMAGLEVEVLPLGDRHRVLRAAAALRRRRPDVGVLLTPSFSAALIFALAGVRVRRGTSTDGRRWLLTDPVDRRPLLRGHRVFEYLRLVEEEDGGSGGTRAAEPVEATREGRRGEHPAGSPRVGPESGGGTPGGRPTGASRRRRPRAPRGGTERPPVPRLRHLDDARSAWRDLARREGLSAGEGPVVGLVPGSNAPARRWPADRFRELAGRLAAEGSTVRVFGAPGEEAVTAQVAEAEPGVQDLGGRTDLHELTGGLAACDAVVANDTGAAHLAAAVARPLVVVWGSGDPRQTRPPGPGVRVVARPELPCHPCVEASCPRRGAGYVSEEARRECLTLVRVDRVGAALRAALRTSSGADRPTGAPARRRSAAGRPQRGGPDG